MKWFRPTDNAASGAPRRWTDIPRVDLEPSVGCGTALRARTPGGCVRSWSSANRWSFGNSGWSPVCRKWSRRTLGAAIIVPAGMADRLARLDLAQPVSPMPAGRVLVRIRDEADAAGIEIAILEAYASAMSSCFS
jgi:hypothetical protein